MDQGTSKTLLKKTSLSDRSSLVHVQKMTEHFFDGLTDSDIDGQLFLSQVEVDDIQPGIVGRTKGHIQVLVDRFSSCFVRFFFMYFYLLANKKLHFACFVFAG